MASAFRFEESDGKIGLLTFDIPGQKVNTFSEAVLGELAEQVSQLEQRTDLKGLFLQSGKPGQFIAGADLGELGALVDESCEQVAKRIAIGHELFDRVSRLPFPTVALIDGNCMGGGTELVLAFDYRIASNSPKTKIALPEVKVGLIPGWGGTQRLPRLIGVQHAIDMICSGDPLTAEKATTLGLVFDAVPFDEMFNEAQRLIEQNSDNWEQDRKLREQPLGLSEDQLNFAFLVAEGYLKGKTKGHYPAPLAALKALREGINLTLEEGLAVEREVALGVIGSPVSANLIGVFFKTNYLSSNPGADLRDVQARDIERAGVLGAGIMGAGIATAHARVGIPTALVEVDNERLNAGLKSAAAVVESRINIGRATQQDLAQTLGLLSGSLSHQAFADNDVVIEAIVENESVKTEVYGQLAGVLRDDAILASNTSTISITRLAKSAPNPERFAGMHFFSPVDRMPLVEIVRGEQTSDETIATLVQLARRIRKTPIVVNDCAGFLVNRLLMPYMAEAILMLTEGASMDAIDRAATRFGMPLGPISLHDNVGIDTICFAGRVMLDAYQDRTVACPLLDEMVEHRRCGKKTGLGFYSYKGKKGKAVDDPDFLPILDRYRTDEREFTDEEITDRLFLPMLLEAVRALEDGIAAEPTHVDMSLILGVGFPPFRGGILSWCDTEGAGAIIDRADTYVALGKRFEATDALRKMASQGERFFPNINPARK